MSAITATLASRFAGRHAKLLCRRDEVFQLALAPRPTATRHSRAVNAFMDRRGNVGRVKRNAGVEHDDLARRALDVGERFQHHRLRLRRVAAP